MVGGAILGFIDTRQDRLGSGSAHGRARDYTGQRLTLNFYPSAIRTHDLSIPAAG